MLALIGEIVGWEQYLHVWSGRKWRRWSEEECEHGTCTDVGQSIRRTWMEGTVGLLRDLWH